MKTGKTLFWVGLCVNVGVIITYLILMIIGVDAFASWIVSLSLCGIVLVGSVLMLLGRSLEKHSAYDVYR